MNRSRKGPNRILRVAGWTLFFLLFSLVSLGMLERPSDHSEMVSALAAIEPSQALLAFSVFLLMALLIEFLGRKSPA
jgi:hypothetical protein